MSSSGSSRTSFPVAAFAGALASLLMVIIQLVLPHSSSQAQAVYTPAAYGVAATASHPGECYYVKNPAEVKALKAKHRCPENWVPTQAPSWYLIRYYPYLTSNVYMDSAVPKDLRASYVSSMKTFGSVNATEIRAEAPLAQYRAANGKLVTADKVGITVHGSGDSFGSDNTHFGSGDSFGGTSHVDESGHVIIDNPNPVHINVPEVRDPIIIHEG